MDSFAIKAGCWIRPPLIPCLWLLAQAFPLPLRYGHASNEVVLLDSDRPSKEFVVANMADVQLMILVPMFLLVHFTFKDSDMSRV